MAIIFRFPVTIRLLDPPLHEFLPHEEADVLALSKRINRDVESVSATSPTIYIPPPLPPKAEPLVFGPSLLTSLSCPLQLTASINALEEVNPMLGFRGCRLSILYPEITEMQVRAVIQGQSTSHFTHVLISQTA